MNEELLARYREYFNLFGINYIYNNHISSQMTKQERGHYDNNIITDKLNSVYMRLDLEELITERKFVSFYLNESEKEYQENRKFISHRMACANLEQKSLYSRKCYLHDKASLKRADVEYVVKTFLCGNTAYHTFKLYDEEELVVYKTDFSPRSFSNLEKVHLDTNGEYKIPHIDKTIVWEDYMPYYKFLILFKVD